MKDKIILFGAGNLGKEAYRQLERKCEILCFVDNNRKLAGTTLFGVPVAAFEQLDDFLAADVDIVVCSMAYVPIGIQLNGAGIYDYYIMIHGHIYVKHRDETIRTCCRCVMCSDSDERILFDEKGNCNYCTEAYGGIGKIYFPNEEGAEKLTQLIKAVKESGKGKRYDCIMGVSGGLDSSYLAYLGSKWGLKVLAIHIDDGFDTEISKSNLGKLIAATGFDYEVVKPDATQFHDLLLAYMRAGVPNIAIPQDNVLFAFLFKKMKEYGIQYFLSGGNFALECILQKGNSHSAYDDVNILDIHKKHGKESVDKLEFISHKKLQGYKEELGIEMPTPLDYIDYNREKALAELASFCEFEYYGQKHLENMWTAFTLLYWLPKKAKFDTRTSHLSSMIVSGQITRKDALEALKEPLYDEQMMAGYIGFIEKKLRISDDELRRLMDAPVHQYTDYAVGH